MTAMMRPPRRLDPYAGRFWEFTKDKELRLQRCAECGKFRWPPSPTRWPTPWSKRPTPDVPSAL